MKTLFIISSLFLLISCNNTPNPKSVGINTAKNETHDSLPVNDVPNQSSEDYIYDYNEDIPFDMEAVKAKNEESPKKLKYLFSANGGLIAYFDDGSVVGCPRCDLFTSNVLGMFEKEPHATYIEYPAYLLVKNNDYESEEILFENGNIIHDWVIINYHYITFREMITNFKPYIEGEIETDSIQEITDTGLITLKPEIKHFDDEESEEAEAYFTAIDDLAYYLSETFTHFNELGIENINVEKRYLVFTIENNEKIVIDTEAYQNDWSTSAYLYKQGQIPIIVDIVDRNAQVYKHYLGLE